MYCNFCGIALPDGAEICPNCGRSTEVPVVPEPEPAPVVLTRKEFYLAPENTKLRNNLMVCGILGYVIAGINLIIMLLTNDPVFAVVNALILLALALLIHLKQSLASSIIYLVYGVANLVIGLILLHAFTGWLIIAVGVDAVVWTARFRSAWNRYRSSF